jgi:hypothetical protein
MCARWISPSSVAGRVFVSVATSALLSSVVLAVLAEEDAAVVLEAGSLVLAHPAAHIRQRADAALIAIARTMVNLGLKNTQGSMTGPGQ